MLTDGDRTEITHSQYTIIWSLIVDILAVICLALNLNEFFEIIVLYDA